MDDAALDMTAIGAWCRSCSIWRTGERVGRLAHGRWLATSPRSCTTTRRGNSIVVAADVPMRWEPRTDLSARSNKAACEEGVPSCPPKRGNKKQRRPRLGRRQPRGVRAEASRRQPLGCRIALSNETFADTVAPKTGSLTRSGNSSLSRARQASARLRPESPAGTEAKITATCAARSTGISSPPPTRRRASAAASSRARRRRACRTIALLAYGCSRRLFNAFNAFTTSSGTTADGAAEKATA